MAKKRIYPRPKAEKLPEGKLKPRNYPPKYKKYTRQRKKGVK